IEPDLAASLRHRGAARHFVNLVQPAMFETARAPKLAQALESVARKPTRDSLRAIMANAKSAGLFLGDPDATTEKFLGLLLGDLMTGLLLQVTNRPSAGEIARRAREATMAVLHLYPEPG